MDFIISPPLFSKETKIKKIMDKHDLLPRDVIYIGDETRDIDSAKKAGVRSIAVTWGWNGRDLLRRHDPEYIVDTFEEIIPTIVLAGNE